LTPEVLTLFILNLLFAFFATVAFVLAIKINLYYDKNATTSQQYRLEKQSYLSATIIKYILAIKIPLFIFFIFTLDKISIILPGAMCGAGVVNATSYGLYLLVLKILNLYFFAYWVVLNTQDMNSETQPYIKLKFKLFILLYLFFMVEIILEATMFLSIDIKDVVDCCGVIFSSSDSTYMATLINASPTLLLTSFYSIFIMLIIFYLLKKRYLFAFFNTLFLLVSLISLISFFGTYIYEMPTHHCPFCFLQREYNYIGYILYIVLFIGTFYGVLLGLIKFDRKKQVKYFNISLLFNTLYLSIVSGYVLLYYIKNAVWL